ncbi:MAG: hypothetical protein KW804_01130 [Candidatus Doudnabacteria bacterium]|nr:hypothetical protein [Candidatus Doudnabacteria bacterium]
MKQKLLYKEEGAILLFALVFMLIILIIIGSLVGYAGVQIKAHRQAVARVKALSIAEAGIEQAIWKLNHQSGYLGETNTSYGDGTFTVTTTYISSRSKLIKVDAYVPSQSDALGHRQVQITATIGTENFGFVYGVQVGTGGLVMDNNTTIVGNVYANGNIVGGNNASLITGDVITAGSTGSITKMTIQGNSQSHTITNSSVTKNANHFSLVSTTVGQNASVNSLSGSGCSVSGNASYNTRSNCTVNGTVTTPNPSVPADAPAENLPLADAQVAAWENEAADGGTISGFTLNGNMTLGPKKINGNLIVNGTLTMTGTLWITGNLTISNGSFINLDPSFGSLGGQIVVGTPSFGSLGGQIVVGTYGNTTNGLIDIQNGSTLNGSGTAGSYMMLISQKDTRSNSNFAIRTANNVSAAVLYAGYGTVEVINNATLKEVTAWKLHLNNLTTVIYDTGFASAQFSEGPHGGWEVARQSWQLLN